MDLLKVIFLLVFVDTFATARSSEISFLANPNTVIDGLTEHVSLRCSLNDTSAFSSHLIGRRGVTSTTENKQNISSISITHYGMTIASISEGKSIQQQWRNNMQVSGGLLQRFLEATIEKPEMSQFGRYSCEIRAMTSSGDSVSFTSNTEINATQPTLADIVKELHQGKIREQQHNNQILAQQQTILALQKNISSLQNALLSQQQATIDAQNYVDFQTKPGLQVMLLGGDGVTYGAVMLQYNLRTGLLCDDVFDHDDKGARVVCRMLGFLNGTYADGNDFYPIKETNSHLNKVEFLMDDVRCTGTETDLTQCGHGPWGEPDVCHFSELAGVRCDPFTG